MSQNNQPPVFYVGQKAVCVDDRPCTCGCGQTGLKKGRIYIILDIADTLSVKVENSCPSFYWNNNRFAPIEPTKAEIDEAIIQQAKEMIGVEETKAPVLEPEPVNN